MAEGSNSPEQSVLAEGIIKEKLPADDLGDLLATVGNHEAKALLLASMGSSPYSRKDLHNLIVGKQTRNVVWNMDSNLTFNYCAVTFEPIGLVAKEIIDEQGAWGYIKTDKGRELGDALVGHLLEFSERYPAYSLSDLFGSTNSSSSKTAVDTPEGSLDRKKRAPLIRYRIFQDLIVRGEPISLKALSDSIGEDMGVIEDHIKRLGLLSIITANLGESNKPYVFFKLDEKFRHLDPPHFKRYSGLTQEVSNILFANPDLELSSDDIAKMLTSQLGDKYSDSKHLKYSILQVLAYLAKNKFINRVKFSAKVQSEIYLTDDQRKMLSDLTGIVNKFTDLDPDFLENGRSKAGDIINNPERFSRLLSKVREKSNKANNAPISQTAENLLAIIIKNPGFTQRELQAYYFRSYGRLLDDTLLRKAVNRLDVVEHFKKVKTGQVYQYYYVQETT